MTINRKKTFAVIAILAIALAAIAVVIFAKGRLFSSDTKTVDPYNEPYARMKDPSYLEQLKVQRDDLKDIMLRIDATRREIAALGSDTNSELYVSLTNRLAEQAREVELNRVKSQVIVRERIMREQEAIKAKKESQK